MAKEEAATDLVRQSDPPSTLDGPEALRFTRGSSDRHRHFWVLGYCGSIAALVLGDLSAGGFGPKAEARTGGAGYWGVVLVAGTGFEPVPFRL